MKVCGFTIIRNAVKYDYPVKESILSVLPVCDEFIVLVGNSEDTTLELIQSINSPKIKIHHSVWDDSLRKGGEVLAVETNKAFDLISLEFDWAFYIQADEVIPEKSHANIREAMLKWKDANEVEGLLFKYVHFYGTFHYVGDSRKWYRREIRIIKNKKEIRSYKDAQGFRINNRKLNVKLIDAYVHHYGWVKNPATMQQKALYFNTLWHDADWVAKNIKQSDVFDFNEIDSLERYQEAHPVVMQERIERLNWDFKPDLSKKQFKLKDFILYKFEKATGIRLFEYRNYKII